MTAHAWRVTVRIREPVLHVTIAHCAACGSVSSVGRHGVSFLFPSRGGAGVRASGVEPDCDGLAGVFAAWTAEERERIQDETDDEAGRAALIGCVSDGGRSADGLGVVGDLFAGL